MEYLVSFNAVTDLISDVLSDGLGSSAWASISKDMMSNAIESINCLDVAAGCDCLIDGFIRQGLWVDEYIHRIDGVIAVFEATLLLEQHRGMKVQVDFDERTNSAMLNWSTVIVPVKYIDNLTEDYRHAIERSDYLPERLRRAFDELSRT